jgi:hypothetical protein
MNDQSSGTQAEEISAEIAALAALGVNDLKARWRDLYETEPPPRISRELLARAIAYRLQEREFGGLAPATLRLLERVADDRARLNLACKAAPGTLLIREWGVRPIRSRCTTKGSSIAANATVHSQRLRA